MTLKIEQIPAELLLGVFQFCNKIDLLRCRLVNRRWNAAAVYVCKKNLHLLLQKAQKEIGKINQLPLYRATENLTAYLGRVNEFALTTLFPHLGRLPFDKMKKLTSILVGLGLIGPIQDLCSILLAATNTHYIGENIIGQMGLTWVESGQTKRALTLASFPGQYPTSGECLIPFFIQNTAIFGRPEEALSLVEFLKDKKDIYRVKKDIVLAFIRQGKHNEALNCLNLRERKKIFDSFLEEEKKERMKMDREFIHPARKAIWETIISQEDHANRSMTQNLLKNCTAV